MPKIMAILHILSYIFLIFLHFSRHLNVTCSGSKVGALLLRTERPSILGFDRACAAHVRTFPIGNLPLWRKNEYCNRLGWPIQVQHHHTSSLPKLSPTCFYHVFISRSRYRHLVSIPRLPRAIGSGGSASSGVFWLKSESCDSEESWTSLGTMDVAGRFPTGHFTGTLSLGVQRSPSGFFWKDWNLIGLDILCIDLIWVEPSKNLDVMSWYCGC